MDQGRPLERNYQPPLPHTAGDDTPSAARLPSPHGATPALGFAPRHCYRFAFVEDEEATVRRGAFRRNRRKGRVFRTTALRCRSEPHRDSTPRRGPRFRVTRTHRKTRSPRPVVKPRRKNFASLRSFPQVGPWKLIRSGPRASAAVQSPSTLPRRQNRQTPTLRRAGHCASIARWPLDARPCR